MSPIKAMPFFLAALTPFLLAPASLRAEQPIVLAQAQTPQQKEEEERKRKAQEQQHQQPQKQAQEQKAREEQLKAQQQKQAQEQKAHEEQLKAQQQKQAEGQKAHEEQLKAQQQKQAQEQKAHEEQLKAQQQKQAQESKAKEEQLKAQEQQHAQQQKIQEEQHKNQELKAKEAADQKKQEQEAAKLHSDQAKIQQLQQQQHSTEHQLHNEQQKAAAQQQQAHHEENKLHRELSAEEQKAKAERDAHAADRQRLLEKQKQMAATEKSQAAIDQRLRQQNEKLKSITSQRQQSVDRNGQTVFKEPGNRTILQVNGHAFVQHDESVNFRLYGGTAQTVRAANGNNVSTIVQPGGFRLEIEVDPFGRPLRRVRILPDGRRFVLFENRAFAIGAGFALGGLIVSLPRVHYDFPPEQYIVDADYASEDDIYGALRAGPVEPLDRTFSLDEVLASVDLRERMRSISIDSINFEFGSWDVGPDQAAMLESVAAVMRDIANQNPGEVFLIEGHTDAVGSDVDNLSLSDRRAAAVADVLSQQFGIPRENLVTQGYGKQFLLIPTDAPERRNRRVVVRRITPLLQGDQDRYSSGYGGPGDQGPR